MIIVSIDVKRVALRKLCKLLAQLYYGGRSVVKRTARYPSLLISES